METEMPKKTTQPTWLVIVLQVVSPVSLASGLIYLGSYIKQIETTTFSSPEEKSKVIDHVYNKYHAPEYKIIQHDAHMIDRDAHMPLKDKQEMFVTRMEYNLSIKNIEKALTRIEQTIAK